MDLRLSQAIGSVKIAVMDVAVKSGARRLQMYNESIQCKPGCHFCCKRLIIATVAEAVLIYEHLLDKGKWAEVKEESRSQFALIKEISSVSWFKTNRSCPVLDQNTGLCKSYGIHPVVCSTHFVTSHPSLCDPWSVASGTYESLDMEEYVDHFKKRLLENVDNFGIMKLEVPLPIGLLLAERISIQTGLDLNKAISLLWSEFS